MAEKNPKKLENISVLKFLKMVKSAYDNSERDLNDKDRKNNMSSASYCQDILELSNYENYREDLLSCSKKLKKIEENYSKMKPNLVTLNKDEFEYIVKCFTKVCEPLVEKSKRLIKETRCGYGGLDNVDELYKIGIEFVDKILEECPSPPKDEVSESKKTQSITDIILYCGKLSSACKNVIQISDKNLEELKSKAEIVVNMELDMSVYNYILPGDFSIFLGYVRNVCNLAAKGILHAAKFAIERKKANEPKRNEHKKNNGRKISNSKKSHGERRFFSFLKNK